MLHDSTRPAYQLEKYSSAVSLSDMEIFVFLELLYSLVLANIMSPVVWTWREDPWFAKIEKMTPYRRVMRLKQFIIDRYEFNLDLDTWGLTTKDREIDRFKAFIDLDVLAQSNALFGYTGDKYYFDMDIRRHFGLDKYNDDVIPYWKTETVEAMEAFKHRPGYSLGAGECVSLSTLYAAALYVVCGIPLEDIYLLATPLHSQNFVNVADGIITNNRRIVTKRMWFNGTELTARAQRALRNERITIVANNTGYVHTMYPEATIQPDSYHTGMQALSAFLRTPVDMDILANFLRDFSPLQKCFQIRHDHHGRTRYIAAEKVYAYEHNSPFRVNDETREKLLEEMDAYEFFAEPIPDRILLNKFDDFFRGRPFNLDDPVQREALLAEFACTCAKTQEIYEKLCEFVAIQPRLPHTGKTFIPSMPIDLPPGMSRMDIIQRLRVMRAEHPIADLAFYAYRDLSETDWEPFLKAAFERNPVCITGSKELDPDALVSLLHAWPNSSIYEGPRLAQPDEVWNFSRGDGAEKALLLSVVLQHRDPASTPRCEITPDQAIVTSGANQWSFPSTKGLSRTVSSELFTSRK